MSVATATRQESLARTGSPQWILQRLQGVLLHIAVIGLTVVWIVPTLGLLISSFRPTSGILTSGWWTALAPPFQFTLQNYSDMLDQSNLGQAMFNSFMVSIPSTVIPVTIAAFSAYAFAWMKFPGRDWIFLAFVGLLAVPLQLTFVPVLTFFVAHGIVPDNLTNLGLPPWVGLWLAHAGYGLWNDLLVALIYVGGAPEVGPLTVNLAGLTNSLGQGYNLLTAAAFFSMVIPLAVFLSLQRYFVRGILAGSVKG